MCNERYVIKLNTVDCRTWIPPSDLTSHVGAPLSDDLVFFSKPPNDIGDVISAGSNLRESDFNFSRPLQVLFIFAITASLVLLLMALGANYLHLDWIIGTATLTMGLGLWLVPKTFVKTNTFVGTKGIAQYTKRDLSRPARYDSIMFVDVRDLRRIVKDWHRNGSYEHTQYKYIFSRADNHRDFVIAGYHKSEDGNPPPTDYYWFSQQAEKAWEKFLSVILVAQHEKHGYVEFPANRSDYIRVSSDYLEVSINGNVERINRHDIDKLFIFPGEIFIRRTDAKLFGKAGKFTFKTSKVGNVMLFLKFLYFFDYEIE